MKIFKKIIIVLITLITFSAWTLDRKNDIKKADWLLGTWANKTKRGIVYETWTKKNKNEYAGKSYILQEKDTIVFETVRLVQEPEGLFYIPNVKNQNNALPVRFKNKSISNKEFVFENTEHDFPQIISYKKINSDSLLAEISGTKNGKYRKQSFPMKRIK